MWYRKFSTKLAGSKWYIVIFFLFILSFNFNIFGLGQTHDWFKTFQDDSSSIVVKTAECSGVVRHYSGPLLSSNRDAMTGNGCQDGEFKPYVSQFGLQARAATSASSLFSNFERGLKLIEILLTFLFAGVLTLLVWKVRNQFGGIVSTSVSAGLLLSPWLAAFSYNLYWVVFTLFLPFVFSFCTYEYFSKNKRMIWFYSILLLLFLLKFLNGYEYASTMVFSAFIPIALFELKRMGVKPLLGLWRSALVIGCAGIIALMLAITANAAALKNYAGGWSEAFQAIEDRAEVRSSLQYYQRYAVSSMHRTAPSIYESIDRIYDLDKLRSGDGATIKYSVLSAINYMMLPAVSLPLVMKEPFGTIIQSILVISLVSAAILWYLSKKKYKSPGLQILTVLYWLGLLGALSWLVLMPGHGFVHPHINAIIFYMPFLIACYGIIGEYIAYRFIRMKAKKSVKG